MDLYLFLMERFPLHDHWGEKMCVFGVKGIQDLPWGKLMWTGEMKTELFGQNCRHYVCWKNIICLFSSLWWSTWWENGQQGWKNAVWSYTETLLKKTFLRAHINSVWSNRSPFNTTVTPDPKHTAKASLVWFRGKNVSECPLRRKCSLSSGIKVALLQQMTSSQHGHSNKVALLSFKWEGIYRSYSAVKSENSII